MSKEKSPYPLEGVFALSTPADLLAKLGNDLARLRAQPGDPYSAMDFFWTAEHMLDWVFPGDAKKTDLEALRASEILLQVVSHIANGAKHFCVEYKRHTSVTGTGRAVVVRQRNRMVGRHQPILQGGIRYEVLYVDLDGDAAERFSKRIDAHDLAARVYAFWKRRLEHTSV